MRFRGSKGNQVRKGAVLVRTRKVWGVGEDAGVVGLLVELFSMYGSEELTGEAPLMAYRAVEGWRVWSRGQATQCLRSGIADVGGKWREEGRGDETDSGRFRVAFGEDRGGHKTRTEASAGGSD